MANDSHASQPRRGWLQRLTSSEGIFARAMRGSLVVAGAYAFSQLLRLVSNLILARVLFPEAFGLMALVTVATTGLQLLSDIGITQAIAQHRRGDEPAFLDTAFTINVARGVVLWLGSCALAYPMALFYDAPDLARLIPVAGLAFVIAGFVPTKMDAAVRNLQLVRLTLLDLVANVIGVVSTVVLAIVTRSVWSLIFALIISNAAKVVLMRVWLPGHRNRFGWDREAAHDLIHFGKWIFLSTSCYFLLMQGDKMVLGAYLNLAELGTYNIGYFLGSFPALLAAAVASRVMVPLYRDRPSEGAAALQYERKIRRMRYALSGAILGALAVMAFFGIPIVGLLYSESYAPAGPVVVLVACVQMITAFGVTYDQSALAAGDSRGIFHVTALRAAFQTAGLWLGFEAAGLAGALAGQAAGLLLVHAAVAMLARKHRAWDPTHDLVFIGASGALAALAIGWNAGALRF